MSPAIFSLIMPDWIHTEMPMQQRQAARADAAQWLTPRRCRMRLRGRDGSELTYGFSARVVAIGKNGIHAVMRSARVLTASDRVGRTHAVKHGTHAAA